MTTMKEVEYLTVGDWVLCDTGQYNCVSVRAPRRVTKITKAMFTWEATDEYGTDLGKKSISSIVMVFTDYDESRMMYEFAHEVNERLQRENSHNLMRSKKIILDKAVGIIP